MGAQQSQPGSANTNDSQPCCFLAAPWRRSRKDAIGSPLPETPIFTRKHRQHVKDAMARDNPVYSSRYAGLEKEVFFKSSSSNGSGGGVFGNGNGTNGSNDDQQDDEKATIHEGADCEQLLHAKYELLEVMGVGSTSTVHRCVRKSTGEQFACKVIDCQLLDERFQGMMTQFMTEIEALRQLKHSAIIRLYDVYFKADDKIFIVMELMEGGELFDYVVQKGTLTEMEAAQIVKKVTSALVYMHSKNIVHRDLKPENLLLKKAVGTPNEPIEVKVIDFGLAKEMAEPMARTFLGTRGYLAPEMLQRRDYTRAVDTWALGVIVFVLLCGCLPFDDDSSLVPSDDLVKAKFVLRFPRWAKNLSPSAKNLLSHLLDVDPRSRYTAEKALDHPWVRGETAPKGNLLASPGRIRKSPGLKSPGIIGSAKNGRYTRAGRKCAPEPSARTPDTPKAPIVRKGSI